MAYSRSHKESVGVSNDDVIMQLRGVAIDWDSSWISTTTVFMLINGRKTKFTTIGLDSEIPGNEFLPLDWIYWCNR